MTSDPTFLGTVQDVTGSRISVALSPDSVAGLTFIEGDGYRVGQIGSFVRIPIGYIDLFGIVSQVGAGAVPERLATSQPFGFRWMTAQVLGEAHSTGEFQRGVSQYPTVGDPVHLVTDPDLARIYGRRDAPQCIRLGHLASAEGIPALIDANRLVTRHSAVVGATGAGKTTTVVSMLLGLSDPVAFPSSRIIVLDVHGEYAQPLRDRAQVFSVTPDPDYDEQSLNIPFWALTSDELLPLTFGALDDQARAGVLDHILRLKETCLAQQPRTGMTAQNLTVDSPVPFSIHQLWFDLYRQVYATHTVGPGPGQSQATEAFATDAVGQVIQPGNPDLVIPPKYRQQSQAAGVDKVYLSGSPLNIRRQIDGLAAKLRDPRLAFFFRPGNWAAPPQSQVIADLDTLVEAWIGGSRPISILDLSGIPASILTHLVGVLLRILFDALFWARGISEGGRERPVLLVLEEAHSYLSQGDAGPAAISVRRIAKEGRKYGIGLMVVSQRPAEVDSTVLSQCGSIVALRLSNANDRSHVAGAITDNLEGLAAMLPILRTGEAIVFGECVRLPLRLLIDSPMASRRPDSSDPLIYDDRWPGGWNRRREPADYATLVSHWRRQDFRTPHIGTPMNRIPVNSSTIVSIGYDDATRVLEVEFRNGHIYQYFDVPAGIHESLLSAPSVGQFLTGSIKGVYRYARM